MNMKKINGILIIIAVAFVVLESCVMDSKSNRSIRNCTKDTLLIELTESKTPDNSIYYNVENVEDTIGLILPEYTDIIYVDGKKVIIDKRHYALPNSFVLFSKEYVLSLKDTCYIYAIKWHDVTRYTLDEIRTKKLYNKRAITKKNIRNGILEYRYDDSDIAH